jgi:5-methyltetrahydropteroyltriglutamate--homocysteine methyltransferase
LIRAANHSFYPRVGESTLDQQLRTVWGKRDRGRATDDEVAAAEDEAATLAVAEQSRAFIDIVTDGMVRWEGLLSHVARHLEGVEARDLTRWFETNFYDRRPEVTGPIERPKPFLVHGYRVAARVAEKKAVKTVLPGPVTFARLSRDRHYGGLDKLARAVAAALADEVADLAAAGATHFQLDEPMLCRHPEDLDLVADTAAHVFDAAGEGATTVLSTYFGDLATFDPDRAARLPGTHVGLDLAWSDAGFDLLSELPDGKGVALGLFDARTTRLEDATDVAERLKPHRDALVTRDVIVGPQASLELLPRNQAFDKLLQCRYLVEKLSSEWPWAS